jgi:hypothetical protein
MTIDGAAFNTPVDLGAAIWLQRGVGVTGTTTITNWADQSGNARNFGFTAGVAYNSANGIVSFNGTSNYMALTGSANVPNSSIMEATFVIRFPDLGRADTIFSKALAAGVDTNAGKIQKLIGSQLNSRINVGTGAPTTTAELLQEDVFMIISFFGAPTQFSFRINNISPTYISRSGWSWVSTATATNMRIYIGAETTDSVGGGYGTPASWGKFDIVDFCMFDGKVLNTVQRTRLINYYKRVYADLFI